MKHTVHQRSLHIKLTVDGLKCLVKPNKPASKNAIVLMLQ